MSAFLESHHLGRIAGVVAAGGNPIAIE